MAMLSLLLIFPLIQSAVANSRDPCGPRSPEGSTVQRLVADVERIARSGGCLAPEAKARLRYDQEFPDSLPRTVETVGGVRLSGTAVEHQALRDVLGESPTTRWPRVAADCQTVLCAVSALFGGEESGRRVLALASATGYVITVHQLKAPPPTGKREELFSLTEVRAIDEALRELPASFFRLSSLRSLHRAPSWYSTREDTGGPSSAFASYEKKNIALGRKALRPRAIRGYLHHEIAHHVDESRKGADEAFHVSLGFREHSAWKPGPVVEQEGGWQLQTWVHGPGAKFATDYGGADPWEDFAEGVYAYTSLSDALYRMDAWRYQKLRAEVFQGREYRSALWPALQQELDQLRVTDLMVRCLSTVRRVYAAGAHRDGIRFLDEKEESVAWASPGADFSADCAPEGALQQVLSRLKNDPRFCEWGEDRIRRAIAQKVNEQFAPLMRQLVAAREPARVHARALVCRPPAGVPCWLEGLKIPPSIVRALSRPEVLTFLSGSPLPSDPEE